MAYNILKGTVEFTGPNGSLENTVDLKSDQNIDGGKTFNQRLTASAITLGGSPLAHPLISGISNASGSRVTLWRTGTQISGSQYLTFDNLTLTSSFFSGSGVGLTNLQATEITGLITAPQINYGNGITSSAGVLSVSASHGITVTATGVSINLSGSSQSGLSFVSGELKVDPISLTALAPQTLADGDLLIVEDISHGLRKATLTQLMSYITPGIPSAAITTYSNPANNRILTSVNNTSVNSETNLTFDGSALAVAGSLVVQQGTNPIAQFINNTDTVTGGVIDLINSRAGAPNAGQTNDFCGGVVFKAPDSTSVITQYGKIATKIASPTNTAEAGKMTFEVTTGGTTATTYLTLNGAHSAITSSVNLGVTGNISGSGNASIHKLSIGHPDEGASSSRLYVKSTDNEVVAIFKSPSQDTILAITGSGQVAIGGIHLDAKFNVTGSNIDKLISVKSDSANPAFYVSGSGDAYISGSLRAKQIHITTHKYVPGDPSARYLRFDSIGSDTSAGSNNKMVAPFPGKLIKIMFRSETAADNTTIGLHKASNGSTNLSGTPTEEITVNCGTANTTYSFAFSDSAAWSNSGDIIGIKITPTADPVQTIVTAVWEFDQNQ